MGNTKGSHFSKASNKSKGLSKYKKTNTVNFVGYHCDYNTI